MKRDNKSITDLARELRKNPTASERKLWQHLRKRQLNGYKFLRQKPIVYKQRNQKVFFFIADFYCAETKLVIEVDGKYHEQRIKYDKNRDLVIQELGLDVLRIKNKELEDINAVLKKIKEYL